MRILPINNVYTANTSNFKAKPPKTALSKIADKALLPAAVCAYIFSPLLGLATPKTQAGEFNQIQYEKEFVMDNKNYTMTYVNTSSDFGENAVSEIYFTPEDTKQPKMRLESMTKYVSDDMYNVSVTVSKPDSDTTIEIVLPKEVGNELLDLYDGETDFFVIPGFNTYSEINTDAFM